MAGTYYTVRALKRVKADGVERVPGDAGTQDFVVDTATRDLLVNLGIASLIGTASSAPTVSRPLTGLMGKFVDGVMVGIQDSQGNDVVTFSGVGAATSATSVTTKRVTAIWKPRASQMGHIASYGTTNAWAKVRAPGKFSAVRVWVLSRGYREASGFRAAVAPTDKALNDTVANSYLPRKGAVTSNVNASDAAPYGWRQLRWGGGEHWGAGTPEINAGSTLSPVIYPSAAMRSNWDAMGSDHAISSFVRSDWMPMPSVPCDDGSGNYYILVKIRKEAPYLGVTEPGIGCYEWTIAESTAVVGGFNAVPGSKLPAGNFASDPTATPTGVFVSGTDNFQTAPFFLEFDLDLPAEKVRSFAFVGESHIEGFLYPTTAFAAVKPSLPVGTVLNYVPFGMSSNRSSEYFTNFENYLRAGLGVTDVVMQTLSTNDTIDSPDKLIRSYMQISKRVDEYLAVGIRPWIILMFVGGGTSSGANLTAETADYWNRIRTLCSNKRIPLIDIAKDWQYNAAWLPDNVHPGAPGIALWNAQFEAALRLELGV